MRRAIAAMLKDSLCKQGYGAEGEAPNGTMGLSDSYLETMELEELFDLLIRRREKVWGSVAVVGQEAAKSSFDDVQLAIIAIKQVVHSLANMP